MDKRILVLDTNVLLTEPQALYKFPNAEVIIPQTVLQELDKIKMGRADKAIQYNGRLISRYLFSLSAAGNLTEGVELENNSTIKVGELDSNTAIPPVLKTKFSDDQILALAHQIQQKNQDREVVIVTNDLNMLIKAQSLGLKIEHHKGPNTSSRIKRFLTNQIAIIKKNPIMALFIALILGGIIAIIFFLTTRFTVQSPLKGPPELVAQVQLYEAKERQYASLLEKNPASKKALFGLSELHVEMGRYYQDSEHYSKAIELLEQSPNANSPLIKATISRMHFYLEMNDVAYSELDEIVRQKNQAAFNALTKQANIAYDYKEYSLAIIFYRKAINLKPNDIGVRLDLAQAYYGNNQPKNTIDELHKALEIDSKNAVIYYNLGYVYWQKRSDATTAISYFEKYLELEPKGELSKEARHNIAFIKKELKG